MTWNQALDLVVARTGHEPFRRLCAEDNPDAEQRDAYRALMVELATGEPPAPAPEDRALQSYVAEHGCGGCPG